jgi:hypothetical protein
MRLILGAKRPDTKNARAANFRVYLKPACQANRAARKMLRVRGFYEERPRAAVKSLVQALLGLSEPKHVSGG